MNNVVMQEDTLWVLNSAKDKHRFSNFNVKFYLLKLKETGMAIRYDYGRLDIDYRSKTLYICVINACWNRDSSCHFNHIVWHNPMANQMHCCTIITNVDLICMGIVNRPWVISWRHTHTKYGDYKITEDSKMCIDKCYCTLDILSMLMIDG